jgi:hypothetical protein
MFIDENRKAAIKRIEICHPNCIAVRMIVDQMRKAAEKGPYLSFFCTNSFVHCSGRGTSGKTFKTEESLLVDSHICWPLNLRIFAP